MASERHKGLSLSSVALPSTALPLMVSSHCHTHTAECVAAPPTRYVCVPAPGEVQAFQEELRGRQYINEVYKFSVDKMFSVLFTESPFMRGFLEQRRFSGEEHGWTVPNT